MQGKVSRLAPQMMLQGYTSLPRTNFVKTMTRRRLLSVSDASVARDCTTDKRYLGSFCVEILVAKLTLVQKLVHPYEGLHTVEGERLWKGMKLNSHTDICLHWQSQAGQKEQNLKHDEFGTVSQARIFRLSNVTRYY